MSVTTRGQCVSVTTRGQYVSVTDDDSDDILVSIGNVPSDSAAACGDDPFSAFISLRSSVASTTRNNPARSKHIASRHGQYHLYS